MSARLTSGPAASLVIHQPFAAQMTWPNATASLAPRATGRTPQIPPTRNIAVRFLTRRAADADGGLQGDCRQPRRVLGRSAAGRTRGVGDLPAGREACESGGRRGRGSADGGKSDISLRSRVADERRPVHGLVGAGARPGDVREGRWSALAAGIAAGFAILTRPNLLPLAAVPAAMLAWGVDPPRVQHHTAAGLEPAPMRRRECCCLSRPPFPCVYRSGADQSASLRPRTRHGVWTVRVALQLVILLEQSGAVPDVDRADRDSARPARLPCPFLSQARAFSGPADSSVRADWLSCGSRSSG